MACQLERGRLEQGARALMVPLIGIGDLFLRIQIAGTRLIECLFDLFGHFHAGLEHFRGQDLKAVLGSASVAPAFPPVHVGIEFASGHKGSFSALHRAAINSHHHPTPASERCHP